MSATVPGPEPRWGIAELRAALLARDGGDWLRRAEAEVNNHPDAVARLFAEVPRRLAPHPVAGWPAGVAGRAVLLAALLTAPAGGPDRLVDLYRYADSGEKLAILCALPELPDRGELTAVGLPLLHDALRTNDIRLVAAALGPYARHLGPEAWRQGVLKCVFMGIPLAVVDRLSERADAELAVMLHGLAAERLAAGRDLPADAVALLRSLSGPTTAREN
ncbi:EboA domain-containing protein [Pilimelia columellifera]|uniref:EboA domain-containing protein n=1 Tax=Pilimelia columellifera subsp. columellifera TaxID=706583 RepID=A0ABP6B1V2_9ACTN